MPDPKLRVLARGTAMVQHYEAAPAQHGQAPQRRISHHHDPNVGPRYLTREGPLGDELVERRHGAWIKKVGDVQEVPFTAEYFRHLRDGDLYPADDETASTIGFPFTLRGKQLVEAIDHNRIPHQWRAAALKARDEKTQVWDQVKAERDEEHGEVAVAEHKAAVAELRQEQHPEPEPPAPEPVPQPRPAPVNTKGQA